MTLRSRSRRHRSHLPSHRSKLLSYEFFPPPRFGAEVLPEVVSGDKFARTRSRSAFPIHLPCLSRPFGETSPDEAGSRREKSDSKVRICFSTSLFTFSRRRAPDEWGASKGEGSPFSSYTFLSTFSSSSSSSSSLSSSSSFSSFSFFLSFSPHSPFDYVFSIEGQWRMVIGIKLCGAPALMLRNVSKLGKFDLSQPRPMLRAPFRSIQPERIFLFYPNRSNLVRRCNGEPFPRPRRFAGIFVNFVQLASSCRPNFIIFIF